MQVYCDMERTNCGGEGGWTRVTYVNMSQPGATCPQGLEQQRSMGLPTVAGSNLDLDAYQQGSTKSCKLQPSVCEGGWINSSDAICSYLSYNPNIDQVHFDSLSIMYSIPRKHIWTYTAEFTF